MYTDDELRGKTKSYRGPKRYYVCPAQLYIGGQLLCVFCHDKLCNLNWTSTSLSSIL